MEENYIAIAHSAMQRLNGLQDQIDDFIATVDEEDISQEDAERAIDRMASIRDQMQDFLMTVGYMLNEVDEEQAGHNEPEKPHTLG